MRIRFEVDVVLDDEVVAALSSLRNRPAPRSLESLVADVELRLSDAPRFLLGVHHVAVRLVNDVKPHGRVGAASGDAA